MKRKTKMWAIIRNSDGVIIDSNLDLDNYLIALGEVLKKVDFEPIYSPAIFRSKRKAEKYLKRLTLLKCKVKIAQIEIKKL